MTSHAEIAVRGRVQWVDTDAAGIHHHTSIARFAEAAEAELTAQLGLEGYFGSAPRVRYEVSFESPLRFRQEVTTLLRVEEVGTTSLTWAFEVWGEGLEGRPRRRAASGRYVTVHVEAGLSEAPSGDEPRTTPWPNDWIAALAGAR